METILNRYTASGGSAGANLQLAGSLTGGSGQTALLSGLVVDFATVTQTATEDIGVVSSIFVYEPRITDNLTGDITVAATVYIKSVPTEGPHKRRIVPSGR